MYLCVCAYEYVCMSVSRHRHQHHYDHHWLLLFLFGNAVERNNMTLCPGQVLRPRCWRPRSASMGEGRNHDHSPCDHHYDRHHHHFHHRTYRHYHRPHRCRLNACSSASSGMCCSIFGHLIFNLRQKQHRRTIRSALSTAVVPVGSAGVLQGTSPTPARQASPPNLPGRAWQVWGGTCPRSFLATVSRLAPPQAARGHLTQPGLASFRGKLARKAWQVSGGNLPGWPGSGPGQRHCFDSAPCFPGLPLGCCLFGPAGDQSSVSLP